MSADFLARQIGLIQAAIKRPFDPDPTVNAQLVNDLASYLDGQGISDVRNLRFLDTGTSAFYFNLWNGALLPNPVYGEDFPHAYSDPIGKTLLYWGQSKFYNQPTYVAYSPDNFPVFYSLPQKRENDWTGIFHGVLMEAGIVVSVAFPALGQEIGAAVLGAETAAAYPALATAIGNIAISTALNGGDVQAAVTSAIAGGVGGEVGGIAASASGSGAIGAAASAATRAAITGGDIGGAAAQSLLYSGVTSAGSLIQSQITAPAAPAGVAMDDSTADDFTFDPETGLPTAPDFSFDPVTGLPDMGDPTQIDTSAGYHDPAWSVDGSAEGASLPMPSVTTPPPGPSGVVATGSDGSSLTQLALTGLKLLTSWQQAGQPSIRTANATVRPNQNGTLTNLQTGITSQMPKGTPYLLPNGTVVTNNGDGTYSTVTASGQTSMTAYTGTTITGALAGMNPVVLLGGAALLLVLLTQRSSRN